MVPAVPRPRPLLFLRSGARNANCPFPALPCLCLSKCAFLPSFHPAGFLLHVIFPSFLPFACALCASPAHPLSVSSATSSNVHLTVLLQGRFARIRVGPPTFDHKAIPAAVLINAELDMTPSTFPATGNSTRGSWQTQSSYPGAFVMILWILSAGCWGKGMPCSGCVCGRSCFLLGEGGRCMTQRTALSAVTNCQ